MLKKKAKFLTFFVIIISSLLLLSGCLGGIGSDSDEEDLISQDASIKGQLKDFNENYAASGLVVLENENGEEVDRKYAEAGWEGENIEGGGFEFINLEDGKYTLSIYKLGYETRTLNVLVSDGEAKVLDPIVLEPETDFTNTTKANLTIFIDVNFFPEEIEKSVLTKALGLALDNNHIATLYNDNNISEASRILAPAVAGNDQDKLTNYDENEAENIITSNDIQNITLNLYYYENSNSNLISYLENQWNSLPEITIESVSYSSNDPYNPTDYNLVRTGWVLDNPDPLFNLLEMANSYKVTDTAVNILNEAKLKLDNKSEAMNLIYQAEKEMIDSGDFIVLYNNLYKN